MEVLLSFTGFHDPFPETSSAGGANAGPILTVAAERPFDKVYLFVTPKLAQRSEDTKAALQERHPDLIVDLLEVPLADPTNHRGILRQLRKHFRAIQKKHPQAKYSVSISSGTPHMHACWVLLAASGEIPAKLLQSNPPQFVPEGKSPVREIDLTHKEFPQIIRPLEDGVSAESDEEQSIIAACREVGIIGNDQAFQTALRRAYIYAGFDDTNVLLLGETGSGKENFAKFIHHCSRRSARPLITVNCSGIPESLVESHLFGHRKGAFTGAITSSDGKFKAADGATIFLDELGELPLQAQAKLLRTLELGEIEPVGAAKAEKVNVKVIAATNRDLRAMIKEGKFREDLFQRFGSTVTIPPLRERRADISHLAVYILDRWNAAHKQQRRLTAEAIHALVAHPWPGNVRELANVVKQSAMLAPQLAITPSDLILDESGGANKFTFMPEPEEGFALIPFLDDLKDKLIVRALQKTDQVQSRAAALLGISPQAINQHLKRTEAKRPLQEGSTNV